MDQHTDLLRPFQLDGAVHLNLRIRHTPRAQAQRGIRLL
jgi:hypothetical protein